jgi:hypothetical protein
MPVQLAVSLRASVVLNIGATVLRHKLWGAEITLYEWDHRMSRQLATG